jgi:hypothetical protein
LWFSLKFYELFFAPILGGAFRFTPVRPFVHPSFIRSNFVSHIAQKVFDIESWNLTGILLSMWSCPREVVHLKFACGFFCFVRVIAHDLVKICNFQLVSHIPQKVLELESWNLTGILLSMWSCAPGYFRVDIFSIFKVIALDLVKITIFSLSMHSWKSIWPAGLKVYKNVGQHMYLCTLGFACGFIQYL